MSAVHNLAARVFYLQVLAMSAAGGTRGSRLTPGNDAPSPSAGATLVNVNLDLGKTAA